jgi:hypothetical protein
MPFNGSGLFVLPSPEYPAVPSTVIYASTRNTIDSDIAAGLSNVICKDGQTTVTANIPFNGFKLTNVGTPTVRSDAATLGTVQDGMPPLTTTGSGTAYQIAPVPPIPSYVAGYSVVVQFHTACGNNPTLQISGLASPPNLVKRLADGTLANIEAGDIPANWRSWVVLLSATQALVEWLPRQDLNNTSLHGSLRQDWITTGGSGTAYTLAPTDPLGAYAAGHSYLVQFHAACGNNPTLQISGLASPPNLVKLNTDGTVANLVSGDIPANWRSRVVLLSATQALVEELPQTIADMPQSVAWSGDITPPTITANQNDYNPTGLSTASTLRLSSDASRNITGLAGGADGRILLLHNVGSNEIVLVSESTSSAAANRFAFSGDVSLAPGMCAQVQYDSTSSRWRLMSAPAPRALLLGPYTLSGSGTSITVTGIPSWARAVVVSFRNMSWNGTTGNIRLRLGTSGGVETANYNGGFGSTTSGGAATDGVALGASWNASCELNGAVLIAQMSGTTWSAIGQFYTMDGPTPYLVSNACTSLLAGQLDRIQMLNTGSATFDNGILSVLCMG